MCSQFLKYYQNIWIFCVMINYRPSFKMHFKIAYFKCRRHKIFYEDLTLTTSYTHCVFLKMCQIFTFIVPILYNSFYFGNLYSSDVIQIVFEIYFKESLYTSVQQYTWKSPSHEWCHHWVTAVNHCIRGSALGEQISTAARIRLNILFLLCYYENVTQPKLSLPVSCTSGRPHPKISSSPVFHVKI